MCNIFLFSILALRNIFQFSPYTIPYDCNSEIENLTNETLCNIFLFSILALRNIFQFSPYTISYDCNSEIENLTNDTLCNIFLFSNGEDDQWKKVKTFVNIMSIVSIVSIMSIMGIMSMSMILYREHKAINKRGEEEKC